MLQRRPDASEYDARYTRYVDLVPEVDIVTALTHQLMETHAMLRGIPSALADSRYASDKWTLREVVGHVLDTERLFGFRMFCFARGETAPLSSADENLYVRTADFGRYSLSELEAESDLVRRSHISLLEHLPDVAWDRRGVLSGQSMTVRALGYTMLGHERHHWKVLREKYLQG